MPASSAVQPDLAGLSVSHVWRTFLSANDTHVTALADINLTVQRGEFVCLVGPSGCGKSTLLSIMAGLDAPTVGHVDLFGERVTGTGRNVGFVFQRDLLLEWRTVLDNVLIPFKLRGAKSAGRQDRARELLALVGLDGFENKYPWQLSGGMRQRAAICRALISDPEILFMDEPFGALDALTREQLNADLLKICGSAAITVVFVTHDVPEAVFLGDRVVVMSRRPGRVHAIDHIDLPRPRCESTRDGLDFAERVALVRTHLREGA